MTIKSIRPTNNDMIVPYNEYPHKLKKGGGIKGKADGGVIETDPLLKKTKEPTVVVTPASQYDPKIFETELSKHKKIGLNKEGNIPLRGAFGTQVNALTTGVKSTQDYLYDYMKANKKDALTAAEADALLQQAKMGSYNDYISQAKNLKAYRDLTVVPAKPLNQSVELGGTYNPVMGGGISMEPTTPFDSTHYEYLFPKNTYIPQKKANGGKVTGKGIKGYVEGGNIQEQYNRTAAEEPLSKKPKDYARDTGLGILDWSMQGFGGQDIIKDEDYKTKQGKDTNRLNSGVGAVGSAVGGAVLDYFVPGLGTAARSGKKGIGSIVGTDEGISQSDKEKMAKIDAVGNVAGTAITAVGGGKGIAGMFGNKNGNGDQANYVDENGIDTRTGEIATVQTAAPVTQVTDGNQLTGRALADWKSATTGEGQASILAKYNRGEYQGLEKGGKIVGPGTEKSDSIPAKLEDDGFVVPAVNAKIAEGLREKYLGDFKGKIASLKKGDTPVKVSNGEHYFTKDEKEFLMAKGVDLDALAPNADVSATDKADGGEIDAILADLNKREQNAKAAEEKRKADFQAKLKAEKDAEKKAELQEQETKALQAAKNNLIVLDKKKKAVLDVYEKYKNAPETRPSSDMGAPTKSSYVSDLKKVIADYETSYKKYFPEKAVEEKSSSVKGSTSITEKLNKEVAAEQKKINEGRAGRTSEQMAIAAGIKNNPSAGKKTPVTGKGIAGVGKTGPKELSMAESKKLNEGITSLPVRQMAVEEPAVATNEPVKSEFDSTAQNTPGTTTPAATGTKSGLAGKFDIGKGAALAQAGLGLKSLLEDGDRPVDSLDPDFVRTVDEAKAEAGYGLSPIERSVAERSIDKNRAADIQSIINQSGGNAGVALGNIRAASIAANDAKNNLSAMSEALRLQKKRYADSKVSEKAGMSKQLFNEKLGAFQQDQEAGAMLLGSGIRNLIGSSMYGKEVAEQQKRESMYNPTFNIS